MVCVLLNNFLLQNLKRAKTYLSLCLPPPAPRALAQNLGSKQMLLSETELGLSKTGKERVEFILSMGIAMVVLFWSGWKFQEFPFGYFYQVTFIVLSKC